MHVEIHVPVWNGEKVGIAEKYLADGSGLEVEILYKNTDGNRVYPHLYTMPNWKARGYHLRAAIGKVPALYMIPIKDFDVKAREVEKRYVTINGERKEIIISK